MNFDSDNMSITNNTYHSHLISSLCSFLYHTLATSGLRLYLVLKGKLHHHGEIYTLEPCMVSNTLHPEIISYCAQSTCEFDNRTGEITHRRFCTLGSGIMNYFTEIGSLMGCQAPLEMEKGGQFCLTT